MGHGYQSVYILLISLGDYIGQVDTIGKDFASSRRLIAEILPMRRNPL